MEELKIKLAVLEARQEEHNKNNNDRLGRLEQDFKEFKELVKGQNEKILEKLDILEKHKTESETQKNSVWKTITTFGAIFLGLFTVAKVLFDIFKH